MGQLFLANRSVDILVKGKGRFFRFSRSPLSEMFVLSAGDELMPGELGNVTIAEAAGAGWEQHCNHYLGKNSNLNVQLYLRSLQMLGLVSLQDCS